MQAAAAFADEAAPKLRDAIAAEAPVRTGQLRDSIYHQRQIASDVAHILIKSNVKQARFVVGGTRPHDIYPVNARALHWVDALGDHFAMHVSHPGTSPNPFPARGAANVRDDLRALLRKHIRDNVEAVA